MNDNFEVFDLEESIRLAGGNRKLALELMSMLIDQLPAQKSDITSCIDTDDINNLKQQVHKLHGSSRCCGTVALMNAAKELEYVIEKDIRDRFDSCISDLMNEIDKVLELDMASLE